LGSTQVLAQENSPYSRFGVGDLLPQYFEQSRAMGGISAALFDPDILNFGNPASYAYLNRATLATGIYGNVLRVADENNFSVSGNGSLSHLALGFPVIRNKLGLSMGLVPFSRVQYHLQDETIASDTIIGSTVFDFKGGGETYRAYLGLGYRWQGLSFGANASYFFGNLDEIRLVSFPDLVGSYSTRTILSHHLSGFLFDAGIGYRVDLPNDLDLNFGLSGRWGQTIDGDDDVEWATVIPGENDDILKDSIIAAGSAEVDNDIKLPAELKLGITLRQGYRLADDPLWRFGAEFNLARWSEFEGLEATNPFVDSWTIRAGGEFTPPANQEKNRRSLDYRAGFYYGKSNLSFDNQDLNEFGISFGLGIPVSAFYGPQRNSKISLAFTVGQRGNAAIFKDTFYRGTIGFTLSDSFWFLKSKIN
jgi:hypothetical protein